MPYANKKKQKEFQRNWYLKNKDQLFLKYKTEEHKIKKRIHRKTWVNKNKEKVKIYKKIWTNNNREKVRALQRNLRKKYVLDPNFRIKHNLRNRVRKALIGICKTTSTIKLIGANVDFVKKYLENKFKPGMSWDNYGKWHIDHILPCVSFNLTKPEEQAKCFHYTNLQPLWASENLSKGNRIS